MKLLIVFLVPILMAVHLKAQDSLTNKEAFEQMRQLEYFTGSWKGSGYILLRDGSKEYFNQTEKIGYSLDGTVLLIEGRGVHVDDSTNVVHNALAMLFYDPQRKGFFLDGHQAQGQHTYAKAWVADQKRLLWAFEVPSGDTIKFVIDIKNNIWKEDGYFVRKQDNKEYHIFHMELNKDDLAKK